MRARQEVPGPLRTLAGLQEGVVTREQAVGLGLRPAAITRLLDQGVWRRTARAVYQVFDAEPAWVALAWTGVLLGGDDARLAGLAAGHLHGLVEEPPDEIRVLVPYGCGVPLVSGPWSFRRERPGTRGGSVGGPPRTGVDDTVLDLLSEATTARQVEGWVTTAVQQRLTTAERLRRTAARRRAVPYREVLGALLADVDEGVRSPLERDYLRDVERAHELPVGQRQHRQRGTEVDVYYEEQATLVELDGRAGHSGGGRFRDMSRDNAAAMDGLLTLRFGHADVHDQPCKVALQVAGVLGRRGWAGLPAPCPRCSPRW